jgi:GTPase SAR1 family protein
LKEDLDNWRNELVKLAVTGKSGVGKSSFINAIRNLKSSDDDFSYDDPSDDIMDIIYKKLKERALKISSTSKCLATKPISNMDKKSIISLICKELLSYRKALGFEQQCVKDIFKDDHIRQQPSNIWFSNLNVSSPDSINLFSTNLRIASSVG